MTSGLIVEWDQDRQCYVAKQTSRWSVDILPMIFNHRVVLTPVDDLHSGYEAGWCYFGRGAQTLMHAWLAAMAFDPDVEDEPVGYDKALQRRRA